MFKKIMLVTCSVLIAILSVVFLPMQRANNVVYADLVYYPFNYISRNINLFQTSSVSVGTYDPQYNSFSFSNLTFKFKLNTSEQVDDSLCFASYLDLSLTTSSSFTNNFTFLRWFNYGVDSTNNNLNTAGSLVDGSSKTDYTRFILSNTTISQPMVNPILSHSTVLLASSSSSSPITISNTRFMCGVYYTFEPFVNGDGVIKFDYVTNKYFLLNPSDYTYPAGTFHTDLISYFTSNYSANSLQSSKLYIQQLNYTYNNTVVLCFEFLTYVIYNDYHNISYFMSDYGYPIGNYNNNSYYNLGYDAGFDAGSVSSSTDAYNRGNAEGYQQGYGVGYNEGYALGSGGNDTFLSLITAVVDAPVTYVSSLFNYTILGYNMLNFITALFTLSVILTIIRLILGNTKGGD